MKGRPMFARALARHCTTIVATIVISVAAVTFAATAAAGLSAHLTAAGWAALQRLNGGNYTSTTACARLAGGSADAEAHGVVGLCGDGVGLGSWFARLGAQCGSFTSAGVDAVLDGASPATKARCATDVAGIAGELSGLSSWGRWFSARLAPGACNSGFSADARVTSGAAAVAAHLASDLRANAGPSRLNADGKQWAAAAGGVITGAATAGPDFAACKP
jgi:hypothetical protein